MGGSRNNFPIDYTIYLSGDGIGWTEVAKIDKIPPDILKWQMIGFEPRRAKYVKMVFKKTLGEDSPMISEFAVVPQEFIDLPFDQFEEFANNPFLYTGSKESFIRRITSFSSTGTLQPYWTTSYSDEWITQNASEVKIIYDGKPRNYSFTIPAGGRFVDKIRFANFKIPGHVKLHKITIDYLK